jgi:outer membrane protein OmpA-like peptidoglycan-associated protein
MRRLSCLFLLLAVTIAGCAGKETHFNLGGKEIVFPNGTVFGGASKDQAAALAQILVDSHNQHMAQMQNLDNQIRAASEQNRETAEKALKMLEDLSKAQGSGEITIFFKLGSREIAEGSLEYDRLVRFVDYVARESRGRTVHFVMIGSASSIGASDINASLSQKRAEAPVPIIDKYLINIPHDYYQINGVGGMYSPREVKLEVHNRYQHVRIIGFYETDQLPPLPAGV